MVNCKKQLGRRQQRETPMKGNWHRGTCITGRTQGNDMEVVSKSCTLSWPLATIWLKSCFLIKLLFFPLWGPVLLREYSSFQFLTRGRPSLSPHSAHKLGSSAHTPHRASRSSLHLTWHQSCEALKTHWPHSSKLRSLCISQISLV